MFVKILDFIKFFITTIHRSSCSSTKEEESQNEISPIRVGFVVLCFQLSFMIYFVLSSTVSFEEYLEFATCIIDTILFLSYFILLGYGYIKDHRQKTLVALLFILVHLGNCYLDFRYSGGLESAWSYIDVLVPIPCVLVIYFLLAWKFDYQLLYKSLTISENTKAFDHRIWISLGLDIYALFAVAYNSLQYFTAAYVAVYLVFFAMRDIVPPGSVTEEPKQPTLWEKLNRNNRARSNTSGGTNSASQEEAIPTTDDGKVNVTVSSRWSRRSNFITRPKQVVTTESTATSEVIASDSAATKHSNKTIDNFDDKVTKPTPDTKAEIESSKPAFDLPKYKKW